MGATSTMTAEVGGRENPETARSGHAELYWLRVRNLIDRLCGDDPSDVLTSAREAEPLAQSHPELFRAYSATLTCLAGVMPNASARAALHGLLASLSAHDHGDAILRHDPDLSIAGGW